MRRYLLALSVVVGLATSDARGWTLWSNFNYGGDEYSRSVIVAFDTAGAASSFDAEAADDFVLSEPATIGGVALDAHMLGNLNVEYWIVRFYDDAGGVPGNLLLATTAPGGWIYGPPPPFLGGARLLLATPFAVAANTHYWISLQPAYDQSQGLLLRWSEVVYGAPGQVSGSVAYWRGNQAINGLTAADTWQPVGQKDGIAPLADLFLVLYGSPQGVLCGDSNCDGLVNNGDIDAFLLFLTHGGTDYEAAYPGCPLVNSDTNGDGLVNNGDIDAFVIVITGGGCW